jgi:flavin-dependent dehydrogenase
MGSNQLDVAIIGGGLAGSLLARQLSRAVPGHRIAVFDRKVDYTHNVGESIVELGSHYLIRRLGLSTYLYERHYPKNGLRFFFDSPAKDCPLSEMSEIGSASLPYLPAFQIDRSRMEHDLLEMSARDGVAVHRGTSVDGIELGSGGRPHRITVSEGKRSRSFESRWLVDASGRRRTLARLLGLHVDETRLDNASIWGWFEGVADIDELGSESFRSRVGHTSRYLSTLHFVNRGYWIWFIPLQNGVTSVGVVCEKPYFERSACDNDGFSAWLRQHGAVASLLEGAKPIATQSLDHLAYGTRRFVSPDRWSLVGEAAAFPDPFYSPGTDFIALENDFVADLITRDLGGEASKAVADRAELYEKFLQFRVEAALRLYRNQYSVIGSYEACKLKWDFDISCYYNLWLAPYMLDRHLDSDYLHGQLRQRENVLDTLSNFAALFRRVEGRLTARNEYHRKNQGEYSDGQDCIGFMREVGLRYSERKALERAQTLFNDVHNRGLDLLEGASQPTQRETRPLSWFATTPSVEST